MAAFHNVFRLLKGWQPPALSSELKYRNSLVVFLRERLKNARIETEYRRDEALIDVYVNQTTFLGPTDVFIKIKRDLTDDATLNRLVAEVNSFQPTKNSVVIVLCGKTNPEPLERLRQVYELRPFRPGTPIEIVVVGDGVVGSVNSKPHEQATSGRGKSDR
jgi:hypothetical protein